MRIRVRFGSENENKSEMEREREMVRRGRVVGKAMRRMKFR